MSFQEFKPRQFQQLPLVVKNILIINIVLFIAKFLLADKIDLDRYLDLFPIGTEYFKTCFSPANRFGLVGTLGEQVYVFEEMKSDKEYTIETESNHTSALLKPLLVCEASTAP